MDFIEEAKQFLQRVQQISGLRIVLHDFAHLTRGRLDQGMTAHTCAYCTAVKRLTDGERRCHASDVVQAKEEARARRRVFLRRCYAGVTEAVVPIVSGECIVALIFCGQVFGPGEKGLSTVSARLRQKMPRIQLDHIMAVGELVDLFFRTNQLKVDSLTDFERDSQFAPRKLMQTLKWLDSQLHRHVAVTEAAQQAGLSVSHFEHLFKRHLRVSFREWRHIRRMREAKHLLIETDLKVREVAERVGYEDAAYFHRQFKRMHGISPLQYRIKGRAI